MITGASGRVLLALAVALAILGVPLPAGGAGAPGQLASRLTAFTLALFAVWIYDRRPRLGRLWIALAALAGLAALAALQSLRWPIWLVGLVSPRHAELAVGTRELVAESPAGVALSLAPDLSRAAALALLSAAGLSFAGFVAGARRSGRRVLAIALVAAGLFQVVLGTRAWLAEEALRLRGTFVNPNHTACALEIALAVAFAWAAWAAYAQRYSPSIEHRLALVVPPSAAWLLLAAGLVATGSRAGLGAAAVGLLVQSFLLPRAIAGSSRAVVSKALAAAALAALVLLAVRGAGRLGETTLYEVAWGDRSIVWRQSLELWRRFPLVGTGLGTFGEAFPLVQPAEMTDLYWRRAHNDLIELLLTGGLVGIVLAVALAVGVVRCLVRVLRRGYRTEDRAAGLAGLGAVASVMTHEMLDFGLTLPGIALPLAALVGAAAAARLNRRRRSGSPARGEVGDGRTDRPRDGAALLGTPPGPDAADDPA